MINFINESFPLLGILLGLLLGYIHDKIDPIGGK